MKAPLRCARHIIPVAGLLLAATAARAEPCDPPAPGAWSDDFVHSAYTKGKEDLATAGAASTEGERRVVARRAERLFRDVEARVPCLPPNVVLLAESLDLQGRYRESAAQYKRIVDARAALSKQPFWNDALDQATTGLLSVEERTPTLTIALGGHACSTGAPTAFVDDRWVEFDKPVSVDAGTHTIRVNAIGCTARVRTATVSAGDRSRLTIYLTEPPPAPPAHDTKWLGAPPWVWISAGGLLAAGAGVGAYFLFRPSHTEVPYDCSMPGVSCVQLR